MHIPLKYFNNSRGIISYVLWWASEMFCSRITNSVVFWWFVGYHGGGFYLRTIIRVILPWSTEWWFSKHFAVCCWWHLQFCLSWDCRCCQHRTAKLREAPLYGLWQNIPETSSKVIFSDQLEKCWRLIIWVSFTNFYQYKSLIQSFLS